MNNLKEQINWLQTLIALATLIVAVLSYYLIKEKNLHTTIGGELIIQVLPNLIAALLTIIVVYFLLVKNGISNQKFMIDEIVTRVNKDEKGLVFLNEQEANNKFNLKTHLKSSKQILIIGYSCRYLIAGLRHEFRDALIEGTDIKIILIKPNSEASSLLMNNQKFKEIEIDVNDALQRISEIREEVEKSNRKRKRKIEIKLINWIPSCSMIFAIPRKKQNSSILRLKIYAPDNSTPVTKIQSHMIIKRVNNSQIYEYYERQFYNLWNRAESFI